MCGILVIAGLEPAQPSDASADLQTQQWRPAVSDFHAALSARGPDHIGKLEVAWPTAGSGLLRLQLAASLLQLRGVSASSSPLADSHGNILCFNGELFGGLQVPQGQNDGQCLLEALAGCSSPSEVVVVLSRLRGPWALLYWQAAAGTLWFGRDVIGRRSLLLHLPDAADPRLLLSSVSPSSGLQPKHAPTPSTPTAADAPAADASDMGAAASVAAEAAVDAAAPLASPSKAADTAPALQAGSDYWAELPPGLYSLTAAELADSLQNPTHRDVWSRVQRHAWQDAMVQRLQRYCRDEALLAAPHLPPLSQLGQQALEKQHEQQRQQQQVEQQHQQQQEGKQQQETKQQQQQQQLAEQQHALEAGGLLVLEALRQAVRTRCGCIEGHTGSAAAASTTADGMHSEAATLHQEQQDSLLGLRQQVQQHGQQQPQEQQQHTPTPSSSLSPAPVLVLFSGGVDSMLLAALAHEALPSGVPLELANVCFDAGRSPDRLAARAGLEELARFGPGREWRLIEVNATLADMDAHSAALLQLLRPAGTVMDLNIGTALWLAARAQGELHLPSYSPCQDDAVVHGGLSAHSNISSSHCSNATTASALGGSSTDGSYTNRDGAGTVQESNSFANGVACKNVEEQQRQQGLRQEQQQQCSPPQLHHHTQQQQSHKQPQPQHKQQLHKRINLQQPQLQPQPSLQPLPPQQQKQHHRSAARVVLLGHGADEQCGGYGRHRTSFRVGSWQGLGREMELDVKRLWVRNLGRDDRLVADHGREARHPFLDEGVLEVVLGLPLALVADLRDPPGVGDKRLLREALRQLGLHEAAVREKRAIQFGSRIGKLHNVRHFGSNNAANKRNAGSINLDNLPHGSLPVKAQLKHSAPRTPSHATSAQLAAALTVPC